jgi:hypothetical protein
VTDHADATAPRAQNARDTVGEAWTGSALLEWFPVALDGSIAAAA